MTGEITWSRPARQDLRRLDQGVSQRIVRAVELLATTGQGDVRPLRGREQQWRLRVGDWRVIFAYDTEADGLQIVRVLPRGRACR